MKEMARTVEQDLRNLSVVQKLNIAGIENGFIIIIRVFPKHYFTDYTSYSKQVAALSKKEAVLMVSADINIEDIVGLNGQQVYNIFLKKVIDTTFVFEKKKIAGVDVSSLTRSIGSLRS